MVYPGMDKENAAIFKLLDMRGYLVSQPLLFPDLIKEAARHIPAQDHMDHAQHKSVLMHTLKCRKSDADMCLFNIFRDNLDLRRLFMIRKYLYISNRL